MLTLAIVGCGYWGPNLIRNFNSLSECRVKKICDVYGFKVQYAFKEGWHEVVLTVQDTQNASVFFDNVCP